MKAPPSLGELGVVAALLFLDGMGNGVMLPGLTVSLVWMWGREVRLGFGRVVAFCMLFISTVDQPIEKVTLQALDCQLLAVAPQCPGSSTYPVGRGESRLVCRVIVQVGKGGMGGHAEADFGGVQSQCRIAAMHDRSSTLYQICYEVRDLYF